MEESAGDAAPIAPVLFKSRHKGKGSSMRKRSRSPPSKRDSDSDNDSGDNSDNGGLKAIRDGRKRRNAGGATVSASTGMPAEKAPRADWEQAEFVADRKALLADTDSATKQEEKVDGSAGKGGSGPAPTPGSSSGVAQRAVGPVKAPTNIRTITTTDYSPDVCKDYKKTGFCGFGDNCKFLHSREDYKQGWQLDKEWEAATKGKTNLGGTVVASASKTGDLSDSDDESLADKMLRDIPFACIICEKSYKQPVVTRCGHYFCEKCALDRYRRDPSCAACSAPTTGVFNTGKRLVKLLEQKRKVLERKGESADT